MREYVLMSDAALDLPGEVVESLEIEVVPMQFTLDGTEYTHYPDERELSMTAFYQMMKEGKAASTSQVNPSTYEDIFRPFLEAGKDIIYIALSGGLSSTYQSSVIAAEELMEAHPEAKICCIDSICASVGQGLLVYRAALRRCDGEDFEALAAWIEENKELVEHWFTVDDLVYLKRGGRLSAASAFVGTALNIKPVLSIDKKGELYVESKLRGSKKSMDYLIRKLEENGVDTPAQVVCIGHANSPEAAERIKEHLLAAELIKDAIICNIGSVIGAHVGPGMLALVFMGKKRTQ